ncbi:unnamed protein product [Clonostachys rosea f. rosea IK726]|uniref:Uncharacterized protein n=1 Tax=Clonostachys rosea f. rosea IK726 TaxID=1349383 RepID=A0ACA9U2F4_BIOOC|nr:unnamed protein product [Clonostachys rosea f. rosea IK726]
MEGIQLSIARIYTSLDSSIQEIRAAGQPRSHHQNAVLLYDRDSQRQAPAAFNLAQVQRPGLVSMPLQIEADLNHSPDPGLYFLHGVGGDENFFISTCDLNIPPHSYPTKLSFGVVYASNPRWDIPFKSICEWSWTLWRRTTAGGAQGGGPQEVASCRIPIEIYFFPGSTCFRLRDQPDSDCHVHELIRAFVPNSSEVNDYVHPSYSSMTIEDFKNILAGDIRRKLMDHGGARISYDSYSGSPYYLDGTTFHLGSMIRRDYKLCNCYDLATLVYCAFKSLGKTYNAQTGTETDFFDITVEAVQNWGYLAPRVLFGYAPHVVTNNPFWKGGRAFSKGIDQPLVNTMDPNREAFSSHCFTIFRLPGREAKVIDICVAEQRDSGDQELEFDEASWFIPDIDIMGMAVV